MPFRWDDVDQKTINGFTTKVYRDNYEPLETQKVKFERLEIDHYAHKHLGSELFTYKIIDTNFIELMEERFDMDRIKNVLIPIKE